MTLLTDTQPRAGPLRAVPASAKLVTIVALGVLCAVSASGWVLGSVGLVGTLALVAARPVWRRLGSLVAWWAVALVVTVGLQLLTRDAATATTSVLRMVALCLPALAVMASTAPEELLDTVLRAARPLRRVGLRPDTLALTVALTIRFVPELVRQAETLRDAQRARGLRPAVLPVTVPLLVRCLDRSRTLAEAIVARSFFDRTAAIPLAGHDVAVPPSRPTGTAQEER
ncbi:MAG: energy-coupling factor transporter transmembrane protein EcfT [Micrococcales bacterium]|nr:energy-coupling factor transporter transmembrane protein EcfT [Micrococcales bacterium]